MGARTIFRLLWLLLMAWCVAAPVAAQSSLDGGLRVNIYVDDRRNGIAREKIGGLVGPFGYVYRQQVRNGATFISPASRELFDAWKGKLAITADSGVSSSPSHYAPVMLIVEVANEGLAPIQIANTYLRVNESQTDKQPLIQMHSPDVGCESTIFSRTISLSNLGWGIAEKATIVFAFGRDHSRTEMFRTTLGSLGSVEFLPERALMTLAPGLRTLQKKSPKCEPAQQAACLAALEKRGHLGKLAGLLKPRWTNTSNTTSVVTNIYGTLHYQWRDTNGRMFSEEREFRQEVGIFDFDTGLTPECGAAPPGESDFKTIRLPSDRTTYRQSLPYRGNIDARGVRRFELALEADRASRHKFSVVVETSEGKAAMSLPVDMLYFIPKVDNGGLREVR